MKRLIALKTPFIAVAVTLFLVGSVVSSCVILSALFHTVLSSPQFTETK